MNSKNYNSYEHIYLHNQSSRVRLWFYICAGVFVIFLFLPWTQNIRARGAVTTLYQDQRPQQVNAIIGGRVMKWFVKEGDFVKAGDTLVQLTEVKTDYLDPALLQRTKEQLEGKQLSIEYYKSKVDVTGQQIGAINTGLQLKLNQLLNKLSQQQLKVQADSADADPSCDGAVHPRPSAGQPCEGHESSRRRQERFPTGCLQHARPSELHGK